VALLPGPKEHRPLTLNSSIPAGSRIGSWSGILESRLAGTNRSDHLPSLPWIIQSPELHLPSADRDFKHSPPLPSWHCLNAPVALVPLHAHISAKLDWRGKIDAAFVNRDENFSQILSVTKKGRVHGLCYVLVLTASLARGIARVPLLYGWLWRNITTVDCTGENQR